eukprot:TRINITY_DN92946_c0_g1_i1.p1 TRINITY_DN92946_c0_g1~~TRINITY_DN92946_c0_g1_i1.p1  ORF type:complete len:509 (+),score=109.54 TRINITY_DN92946_c0_g1_i1:3-1529(+)
MAKGKISKKADSAPSKQRSAGSSRDGLLFPAFGAAVIAVLAGAVAWTWKAPRGDEKTLALLASLRAGNCSTLELPTLDLRLLPPSEGRPLAGLQCPAVLLGAFERCGMGDIGKHLSDWTNLVEATHDDKHRIMFDLQDKSPIFTYWDNNSALAQAVRERGIARQGHRKERSGPAAFLKRAAQASSKGWLRYGADLRGFSPALASKLGLGHSGAGKLAPLVPSTVAEEAGVNFWASSAGVVSMAHYDPAWDNLQFVVAGAKHVVMSPLSLAAYQSLEIHPSSHPHARQARHPLVRDSKASGQVLGHTLVASLSQGAGIFIPAGWLHEMSAADDAPTAALSVVSFGREKGNLEALLGNPQEMLTPFFEAPYLQEEYTKERFATVLTAFVPEFLRLLQLDGNDLGNALLASYGKATRDEAGLPAARASSTCQEPGKVLGKTDLKVAKAVAKKLAARFNKYRRELLLHYVLLFFDALLSKVGGSGSATEVLGRMVAWLDACRAVLFPARGES